jgi:hypothetical protein
MTSFFRRPLPKRLPVLLVAIIGAIDANLALYSYELFSAPSIARSYALMSFLCVALELTTLTLSLSLLVPGAVAALLARFVPILRSTRLVALVQATLLVVIATQIAMEPADGTATALPRDNHGRELFTADVLNEMPFPLEITDPTGTCYDLAPNTLIAPATVSAPIHCTKIRLSLYRPGATKRPYCTANYETSAKGESDTGYCPEYGVGAGFINTGGQTVHLFISR